MIKVNYLEIFNDMLAYFSAIYIFYQFYRMSHTNQSIGLELKL